MTGPSTLLLLMALWAADPATITTLDGNTVSGEVTGVRADQIELTVASEPSTIPLANVLEIAWSVAEQPNAATSTVELVDGSVLHGKLTCTKDAAVVAGSQATGDLTKRMVRTVRWGTLEPKIEAAWQELAQRQPKEDLLVIRKGDVLDFISGAVGDVTEQNVAVVAGGQERQAPRERLFGLVLADRPEPKTKTNAILNLATGEKLVASQVTGDAAAGWNVTLKAGPVVTVPWNSVSKLDFGGGRIRYLADVTFSTEGSTSPDPFFPIPWFVSRNQPIGASIQGAPLRIGDQEYRRGLWMCSNSLVRFRLNREFVKLQGVAGFELTEQARMPKFDPQVEFIVEADGRELHKAIYKWDSPPQTLDLDLSDTRELILKVQSKSAQPGVLEFFAIGDAKLLK